MRRWIGGGRGRGSLRRGRWLTRRQRDRHSPAAGNCLHFIFHTPATVNISHLINFISCTCMTIGNCLHFIFMHILWFGRVWYSFLWSGMVWYLFAAASNCLHFIFSHPPHLPPRAWPNATVIDCSNTPCLSNFFQISMTHIFSCVWFICLPIFVTIPLEVTTLLNP